MHLSITSDATQLILQPQHPSDPKVLLVQLHLHLGPKDSPPSHLHSLQIALHRHETLDLDVRPEHNVFEPITLTLDLSSHPRLRPGSTTSWTAILEVPQLASAYQDCCGSRSAQYLLATAHYSTRFWRNRALTARKDIYLLHQPAGPLCFAHTQAGAHDGIGPVLVSARSQHLTIGSVLHLQAQLPAPAHTFQLRSLDFYISQSIVLRSRKEKGVEQRLAPTQVVLRHVRTNELPEQGWFLRIPSCGLLRPSSIGDRLGIHVHHTFSVRFNYQMNHSDLFPSSSSHPEPRPREYHTFHSYTLTWNIHLPSCALRPESIMLPAYAEHDPSPVPLCEREEIANDRSCKLCMCGRPFDELLGLESHQAGCPPEHGHQEAPTALSESHRQHHHRHRDNHHHHHHHQQQQQQQGHSMMSISEQLATKLVHPADFADLNAGSSLRKHVHPVGTEESYERARPATSPRLNLQCW